MKDLESVNARRRLDDFSRRLRSRTAEFEGSGEFFNIRRALISQIERRRDRYSELFAEAKRTGSIFAVVKAELARDFNSISDVFLRLEERLGAQTMKQIR